MPCAADVPDHQHHAPTDTPPAGAITRGARHGVFASMHNVLVVEDNGDHRAVLDEVLSRAGYVVHTAEDIGGFRRALLLNRPSAVVLDLHLQHGQSGFQLLQEWAGWAETPLVPVIACSGDPSSLERARTDPRFSAVIAKPFAISSLVRIVNITTNTWPEQTAVETFRRSLQEWPTRGAAPHWDCAPSTAVDVRSRGSAQPGTAMPAANNQTLQSHFPR